MRRFDYFKRYMKFIPDDGGAGGGGVDSSVSPSGSGDSGVSSGDGGVAPPEPAPSSGDGGSPPSSPGDSTDFDWSNLGSSEDLDQVTIPPQPATPAPGAPAAPVVPPAAPAPAAPALTAQSTPTAPQAPPSEPSAPQAPVLSADDPVGIAAAFEANRDALIGTLAQERFQLSQEDITALETDVVSAVPKLLARVYVEAQMANMRFLAQSVPGMIQKHQRVTEANSAAENKFFDTNKHLGLDSKNPMHRSTALRLAGMYRQAHPNMPLDQLIAEVGPMVAMTVRAQAGAQPQQPAASPIIHRGGTPFRPAVNGGGGAPAGATEPENEWIGLGTNFD